MMKISLPTPYVEGMVNEWKKALSIDHCGLKSKKSTLISSFEVIMQLFVQLNTLFIALFWDFSPQWSMDRAFFHSFTMPST